MSAAAVIDCVKPIRQVVSYLFCLIVGQLINRPVKLKTWRPRVSSSVFKHADLKVCWLCSDLVEYSAAGSRQDAITRDTVMPRAKSCNHKVNCNRLEG